MDRLKSMQSVGLSARFKCLLSQYCQQHHSHKNTFSMQECYWGNFKHFMLWESLEPDGILVEVLEMKVLSLRTCTYSKVTSVWVQSTSSLMGDVKVLEGTLCFHTIMSNTGHPQQREVVSKCKAVSNFGQRDWITLWNVGPHLGQEDHCVGC